MIYQQVRRIDELEQEVDALRAQLNLRTYAEDSRVA